MPMSEQEEVEFLKGMLSEAGELHGRRMCCSRCGDMHTEQGSNIAACCATADSIACVINAGTQDDTVARRATCQRCM